MVNFKCSPTDSQMEQRQKHLEWKSAQKKNKIMTNSTNNISVDISMNSQKLEKVTSSKYLVATLCKDGTCSAEIRIRIASALAAMTELNRI